MSVCLLPQTGTLGAVVVLESRQCLARRVATSGGLKTLESPQRHRLCPSTGGS